MEDPSAAYGTFHNLPMDKKAMKRCIHSAARSASRTKPNCLALICSACGQMLMVRLHNHNKAGHATYQFF